MDRDGVVLVAGAGGFIGGALVADLVERGFTQVRAVDQKPFEEWYQRVEGADNRRADLSDQHACHQASDGARYVFNLAADMGGMGFIENNKALCMLSVLINTHMLMAARDAGVERFFYSSSACVYAADKQTHTDITALAEADAYPAMPEDGYGWEKLFSERMCRHFCEDFGLTTKVARYHNVYGPHGTYDGGREKAPAAICRKVIAAKLSGEHSIEIWGDGQQTRSFMYIDDCVTGTKAIMDSTIDFPINLGSSQLVTINQLVDIAEHIAGIRLQRRYNLNAPQGVRGRNSDNTLIATHLNWEPTTRLQDGLERTYHWIYDQMAATHRAASVTPNPTNADAHWDTVYDHRATIAPARPDDPLAAAALAHFGPPTGQRLLDLGCGTGEYALLFAAQGAHVTAIDTSPTAITRLQHHCTTHHITNLRAHTLSAFDLPTLGQFDLIFGSYILHHLEPFDEFATILRNALTPGGKAFFQENNAMSNLLIWCRTHLVGRYGIPKYSDDDEFPLTPSEITTLKHHFNVHTEYPELLLTRLATRHLTKNHGTTLAHHLDNTLYKIPQLRKYSYRQYLYLS